MELEGLDIQTLGMMYLASENNQVLRAAIGEELQHRIADNNYCSRERLFQISIVQNHSIGINFIPTSDAFNSFGPNITVAVSEENNDLEELMQNYASNPPINTYGNIRLRVLVPDYLTQEQIDDLGERCGLVRVVLEESL